MFLFKWFFLFLQEKVEFWVLVFMNLSYVYDCSEQALDKIRFESLTDKSKLDAQPELFIHIVPDKTNNTLSIIDSGIGMTKAGKCLNWFLFFLLTCF